MCQETKEKAVKRDRYLMHIAMCINSIPGYGTSNKKTIKGRLTGMH
jgi:hypothetical protein